MMFGLRKIINFRGTFGLCCILMVVLLSAFYVNTGWAEASPQPTPLPGRITIGGTTYEIVSRTSMPGEMTSRLPNAYRFQMGQPIKRIDNSVRYWLGDVEFLRTPGGKFALPFEGSAPFVGYIDLAKNEFIYFKEPFTPTGEERGKGSITRKESLQKNMAISAGPCTRRTKGKSSRCSPGEGSSYSMPKTETKRHTLERWAITSMPLPLERLLTLKVRSPWSQPPTGIKLL